MANREKSVTGLADTLGATTWNLTALVLAYIGFVSLILADALGSW